MVVVALSILVAVAQVVVLAVLEAQLPQQVVAVHLNPLFLCLQILVTQLQSVPVAQSEALVLEATVATQYFQQLHQPAVVGAVLTRLLHPKEMVKPVVRAAVLLLQLELLEAELQTKVMPAVLMVPMLAVAEVVLAPLVLLLLALVERVVLVLQFL